MYLTGGQYKGYKILVPDNVKPTLSKVRQGVFNMLSQFEFENNTFLDMFAGSSLMGLEALSRGYKVIELEINPKNAGLIKKNYEKTGIKPEIIVTNSLNYKTDKKFDIVYIDPPWDMDYLKIIEKAQNLKSGNGIIIVEYDGVRNINIQEILDKEYISLKLLKIKKYGRTRIALIV